MFGAVLSFRFPPSLPPSLLPSLSPSHRSKKRRKPETSSDSESESGSDEGEAGEGIWVEKKVKGDASEAFVGPVPEIKVQALPGKLE